MVGEIAQEETNKIIDQFIGELKSYENSQKQAQEIIKCSICGWESKQRKIKRENIAFYRLAEETLEAIVRKDLVEMETWKDGSPTIIRGIVSSQRQGKTRSTWKRGTRRQKRITKNKEVKTVIFITHTKDSGLAKFSREKEEKIKDITRDK